MCGGVRQYDNSLYGIASEFVIKCAVHYGFIAGFGIIAAAAQSRDQIVQCADKFVVVIGKVAVAEGNFLDADISLIIGIYIIIANQTEFPIQTFIRQAVGEHL